LVASFRVGLEEVRQADILLDVVDASDPQCQEQVAVPRWMLLSRLPLNECGSVDVFSKLGRVREPEGLLGHATERPGSEVLRTMAVHRFAGVDQLRGVLMAITAGGGWEALSREQRA
jgi:50S ribosomal subunit-associated GTPase HflX